jgi:DNA-binding response OmpR family regulator
MRILVIEDEPSVSSFIKKGLEEQGMEVMQAFDGETGLSLLMDKKFDLVILDVILPKANGLDVCKTIRERVSRSLPVIMLTALSSTNNVVKGLETGADDYLAKPFKFQELLARIRALVRRANPSQIENVLAFADLELNLDTKTVKRGGIQISLTAKEFMLLEFFLKNPNRVISRAEILENVWDVNFDLGTNIIDVYVNYLRNKVDKGFSEKLIHTVVGMGYMLRREDQ